MILLRRMMQHVRTQNWFAVFLDFVIVVVGVFIGIQVANWNEGRIDRQSERRVLEQLFEEAQVASGYIALIIHRAEIMQVDREAAEAMLRGITPERGNPEAGLASMSTFRAMTPLRAAFDQLTASGEITLVRSSDIRDAVTLYYGVLNFHDLQRREYLERAPDVMQLASGYTMLRYDPDQPLGYQLNVDWLQAGKDRMLGNVVRRTMGDQVAFHELRKNVLEQALAMCARLGIAVDRDCDPPDWVNNPIPEEPRE